jgi:hypothetical protein
LTCVGANGSPMPCRSVLRASFCMSWWRDCADTCTPPGSPTLHPLHTYLPFTQPYTTYVPTFHSTIHYIRTCLSLNHTLHTYLPFTQPYTTYVPTFHSTIHYIRTYLSLNHTLHTYLPFTQPYTTYVPTFHSTIHYIRTCLSLNHTLHTYLPFTQPYTTYVPAFHSTIYYIRTDLSLNHTPTDGAPAPTRSRRLAPRRLNPLYTLHTPLHPPMSLSTTESSACASALLAIRACAACSPAYAAFGIMPGKAPACRIPAIRACYQGSFAVIRALYQGSFAASRPL